ncbi:MAG: IS200/IS605 family transposase [Ignavibacteria bacterium]|nr:IS200/IS605 family transposase [Ignavibacteria bacterium]
MLHSYTKILVHLVWATKKRDKLLTKEARPQVLEHIAAYGRDNNISIDSLNLQMDHVHVLITLLSNQKIDDIVRLPKGESSHWINAENIIPQKFSWQRGYGAFSVSFSQVELVRQYIRNQDEHHRKNSFSEEFDAMLRKHGFDPVQTDESV